MWTSAMAKAVLPGGRRSSAVRICCASARSPARPATYPKSPAIVGASPASAAIFRAAASASAYLPFAVSARARIMCPQAKSGSRSSDFRCTAIASSYRRARYRAQGSAVATCAFSGSSSWARRASAREEIRRPREALIRVGEAGVRERIIRIMRQGLLEVRQRLLDGCEAALVVEVASLEIQLVRLDVMGRAARERQAVPAHQVHP